MFLSWLAEEHKLSVVGNLEMDGSTWYPSDNIKELMNILGIVCDVIYRDPGVAEGAISPSPFFGNRIQTCFSPSFKL